jgi:carbon-monoxide dehydrogenase medium subunit
VKWFDYAAPQSVGDALALAGKHPDARFLAGGTDLIVQLRSGRKATGFVIDVKRIDALNEIQFDESNGLTLGAATPCYQIAAHREIRRVYPALFEVASHVGGTQIQGRASIGGNLCNAAPSADAVPLLIALSATCRIASAAGTRDVAVEDFCTAPGKTVLVPGEILVSLHIPRPPAGFGSAYLRFIPRNEMDIAVAGAAAAVTVEDGVFRSARIALASVAPTPLFVPEAGRVLEDQPVSSESIRHAADIARAAARPITDMRGTADYRRHLCAVLTRRVIESALEHALGAN